MTARVRETLKSRQASAPFQDNGNYHKTSEAVFCTRYELGAWQAEAVVGRFNQAFVPSRFKIRIFPLPTQYAWVHRLEAERTTFLALFIVHYHREARGSVLTDDVELNHAAYIPDTAFAGCVYLLIHSPRISFKTPCSHMCPSVRVVQVLSPSVCQCRIRDMLQRTLPTLKTHRFHVD